MAQWYFGQDSSRMETRIELWKQVNDETLDELGQVPVKSVPVATVWASVVPQTGTLLSGRQAETALSRTTHKIVIRYRKGVTPDMWVMIGDTRYSILYVMDPYMRHETLELFCEVIIE